MCRDPDGYANIGNTYFFVFADDPAEAWFCHTACHFASLAWKSVRADAVDDSRAKVLAEAHGCR